MTPRQQIVVVGGGLAGVLFTVHLLRQTRRPVQVTILDPRDRLGSGVAYSTPERGHITNVPSSRMSADPDDPEAFTRWLSQHGDPPRGEEGDAYPRRALMGDYVRDFLAAETAKAAGSEVIHLRQRAREVVRHAEGRMTVVTDDREIDAAAVILATGNPTPAWPGALAGLACSPLAINDPWRPGALRAVPADSRVLIIGTGLTMGDTVVTLREAGHRGLITAVSRRGQVPQRGLAQPATPCGDFGSPPPTAVGLLRLVRAELACAAREGRSWYGVLAGARAQAWALWAALPPIEQRRAARHIRHVYELNRHVMPGPVHDRVVAERAAGTLRVRAASPVHAHEAEDGVAVTLRPRGSADVVTESFDCVVNCTGPSYSRLLKEDPFWEALGRAGLVSADTAGIGPATDREGRALDTAGVPHSDLLLVGTLARSALGELTGVREISLQARAAAAVVARQQAAVPRSRLEAQAAAS